MAEMRRGVSIRLGVDDGEAKRRIAEFGTTAEMALRKVETSSEGSSRELRQLANSIEAAKRQADPLYAAQQRLAKVTADYNAAVRRGIATEEERGRVLGQLQARYDLLAGRQAAAAATTASFAAANRNASRFSGRFGNTIQQVGFQVGDFATQVASGGNAMTAFVQQGSQLLGFFGPAGAIAGAALAVGAVAANFLLLGDNTDEATGSVRENDRALRDWTITANQAGMSAEALISRNNAAARSFRNLTIEQKRQAMESNLTRQAELNDHIIAAEGRAREVARRVDLLRGQGLIPEDKALEGAAAKVRELREEADKLSKEIGEAQTEIGKYLDVPLAFSTETDKAAASSRGAASAARQQRDATRELKDGVAAYIADLRTQNEMLRLEEGEREKVRAVMEAQARAMEQGNLLTAEQIALVRELVGEKQRITDATEAQKRAEEEARRTAERAAEEQRRTVERTTDDVVDFVTDAWVSIENDGKAAFDNVFEGAWATAKRFFVRLAAEAIARPIVMNIAANVAGGGAVAGSGPGFTGLGGAGAGGEFGLGNLSNIGRLLGRGSASIGNGFVDVAQFLGFGPETQAIFGNAGLNFSSPAGMAGGFAGNFLANSIFGNRGIGADIGGGIGALAGSFIPIPFVGTALGSFLGNILGGLFKGSASGSMGLETLPTPADPNVNPFAGRPVYAHRRSPFGVIGFQAGANQLKGQADEVVDAAGALDRAVARILSDEQVARVSSFLQANPPPISTASSFKEADFRGQILGRGLDILEGLGAGRLNDFEALGLSAKEEGSVAKLGDLVEELVGTLNFLEGATDAYTQAAKDQVGAVVEQADAIRESVEKFNLSAAEAARAEARIREEALKLLAPPEDELSATEQALKSLNATFAELRDNAGKLGLTLADIDPAQDRALADLREGFLEANRRAVLSIADPMALALEDFEAVAAQRLEDARKLGLETVLVERRNALERQRIVEQYAEQTTEAAASAASTLPRILEGLTGFAGDLRLGSLSALTPDERYRAASSSFAETSRLAAAGDEAALRGFEGAARSFLEVSRARFGSTAAYAGDFAKVAAALDRLAAQPQTNWQRLDATVAEAGSETARLLRALIGEVERLRADVRQSGTLRPARVA